MKYLKFLCPIFKARINSSFQDKNQLKSNLMKLITMKVLTGAGSKCIKRFFLPSNHKNTRDYKNKMKPIFSLFIALVSANPMMNYLLMNEVLDSSDSTSNEDLLMMMLMSPGLLGGNQNQAEQMNPLLPLMLMEESSDDNSMMLMMMMMQNGPNGMTTNIDRMLPLLMLNDGETDIKNLFLITTMMQNNCDDTNSQINMLLPLLLMTKDETTDRRKRREEDATSEEKTDSTLKTLLLLQTMSDGNNGLDMNTMMPFLLKDESSDSDNLLLMVMMSSMTGGMDYSDGFADNFNMLLPLLLGSEDEGDKDMLFILLAMQSQAPGTSMGSSAMLPLLMMDSDNNNQELIMFMSMMNNQNCHQMDELSFHEEIVKMPEIDPKPEVETVYRTWKVNSDGTRTLMDEHEVIGA